jgi:hypothetical protein
MVDRKMSTRWIHELAIPGRPDVSSIYASHALAGMLAASVVLARVFDFWPWFVLGMIAVGLQIPLLADIVLAKVRSSLPPPAGHAQMFSGPEPFAEIGWPKALGGFVSSAAVLLAYALYDKAFSG